MTSDGRSKVLSRWCGCLAVMAAIMLAACGGGGSSTQDDTGTTAVSFSVLWDRSDGGGARYQRTSVTDCSDVDTVSADVYSTDGVLLSTGGPWTCAAGSGTLYGVPANQYASIAVAGHAADGSVLYLGQSSQSIFLTPGSTVDAGLIVAGSFVPVLVGPADMSVLAPAALELQWNAVAGATGYQVSLATDNTFAAGAMVMQITVEGGDTTSFRPDVTVLAQDTPYYWRVQAMDAASNLSAPSPTRQFSLSTALLIASIISPADQANVKLGMAVTFTANVTDALGTLLPQEILAAVSWTSSIDGLIGSQLSFTTGPAAGAPSAYLSEGTHTITLNVQSTDGLTGSASIKLNVLANLPPVAQILYPVDGDTLSYTQLINTGFTWQGSATDYEDGTDVALAWSLVKLDDPGSVLWTGTGATPTISFYSSAPPGAGLYRITLVATDSQGATDTVTHDVTFQ